MRWFSRLIAGWMVLSTATVASADVQSYIDSAKLAIRVYTAVATPKATAAQAKNYGLFLPPKLDSTKPLVLLIHGFEMTRTNWAAMADRLVSAGYQVGYFCYPEDQPIADDVYLFRDRMIGLHGDHPKLKIDVVAYSMGSLVARGFVEGSDYTGGVDRLIMLAPPNQGSSWAHLAWVQKVDEQANLYWYNPEWKPSWFITSGLCEAGRDLLPGSKFLTELNTLPRRAGVRYTIVEGDAHLVRRMAADAIDVSSHHIPRFAERWSGVRLLESVVSVEAESLRAQRGDSDGPVQLISADLAGVTDVIRVHADHQTMIDSDRGAAPVAWTVVRDRLGR